MLYSYEQCLLLDYGEPVQLSQAEKEKREWCVSEERGDTISIDIKGSDTTIYSNASFSCNANNWQDVLSEIQDRGIAEFYYEKRSNYNGTHKVLKTIEVNHNNVINNTQGEWHIYVDTYYAIDGMQFTPLKPNSKINIVWHKFDI